VYVTTEALFGFSEEKSAILDNGSKAVVTTSVELTSVTGTFVNVDVVSSTYENTFFSLEYLAESPDINK
jgi:hypothetical protein